MLFSPEQHEILKTGTIVAGIFQEYKSDEAGMDLHVFFKPDHQKLAPEYTTTAVQEFTYFITLYGTPLSSKLNVVELPGDTVPYAWAPEIAGFAGPSITEKTNYRLLANAIAHQWWGVSVSPASKDDWWVIDGFSRYSEAMYVESAAGSAGLEEAIKDMSVGALAYDTIPLSSAAKLDPFSTEFQSLVTDKGVLTETPAILAFVAQTFPQAHLAPTDPLLTAYDEESNNRIQRRTVEWRRERNLKQTCSTGPT